MRPGRPQRPSPSPAGHCPATSHLAPRCKGSPERPERASRAIARGGWTGGVARVKYLFSSSKEPAVTEPQPFALHDLMTPAVFVDPYPAYRRFRDQTPFWYLNLPAGIFPDLHESVYTWALMKHDQVMAALKDHDTFSSRDHLY